LKEHEVWAAFSTAGKSRFCRNLAKWEEMNTVKSPLFHLDTGDNSRMYAPTY
jgi:hypothetical protein